MHRPLFKIQLKVEIQCDFCAGEGSRTDESCEANIVCGDCDGRGFTEIKLPLIHLKNLLDGGDL